MSAFSLAIRTSGRFLLPAGCERRASERKIRPAEREKEPANSDIRAAVHELQTATNEPRTATFEIRPATCETRPAGVEKRPAGIELRPAECANSRFIFLTKSQASVQGFDQFVDCVFGRI